MRVVYLLFCMLFSQITWANNSDLMLLGTYENQDIQGWVMSEKLDGVRGFIGTAKYYLAVKACPYLPCILYELNFHLFP